MAFMLRNGRFQICTCWVKELRKIASFPRFTVTKQKNRNEIANTRSNVLGTMRAADRAVNAMTGFVMGAVFGALLF